MKIAPQVLAPVFLCSAFLACTRGGEAGASARAGGARALNVRLAPVAARDVVYKVGALGSLEAEEMVQVTAEVEGAITEVHFNPGDHVTRQTVLARIDPERYRLEAAQAEAAHRRAVAESERALSDLRRREALDRDQLVAAEDLNRARQDAARLAADAAAAQAALDIALQNAQRADVRPPRAGVINSRGVDTGQFVKVGTVVATLVDLGRLRLRFRVSEAESLRTLEGQQVSFRVAPIQDRQFSAEVYHVGDIADPATRQVEVLAWVKNPGVLKPGFFAEVTLTTTTHKGAVVVPEGAVQASERGFVVYVVEDGRARQRPVEIGLRTGDGAVEILTGLRTGEIVVTEGSDRLADGIAVKDAGEEPRPSARTDRS